MLGLNKNVWLLALAQPFALAVTPAIILISGFIGKQLAPYPQLATLPISVMIIGTALGALPAARLMQQFGRKVIFLASALLGIIASLLAALGISMGSFWFFSIGIFFIGSHIAVVQQFRFAAVENVSASKFNSRAVSVLMLGSVAAGFIGTELATLGRGLIATDYAGSFLTLTIGNGVAFCLLLGFSDKKPVANEKIEPKAVKWGSLMKRPALIMAVLSAAIGYGVMSFVMTATPLAMHDLMGHSLEEAKWVIQSHIMAMFLPSLVTGELIRIFGERPIILAGLLAYVVTLLISLAGVEVLHYWWALVFLGVGWNFMFIGGTTLLTHNQTRGEKFQLQALNDVIVFTCQALFSLSAGVLLLMGGWSLIIITAAVPTLLLLSLLILLWRRTGRVDAQPV